MYAQRGRVLRFLIQVMGVGTQALARVEVGALITLTFPLGNGFAVESPERPVVMVAGVMVATEGASVVKVVAAEEATAVDEGGGGGDGGGGGRGEGGRP